MRIVWADYAIKGQDAAADYIFEEFGTVSLMDFYQSIDEAEEELLTFPEIGRVEPLLENRDKLYRGLVIGELNKLIYYVEGETIFVVDFWDTRREPKAQAQRLK